MKINNLVELNNLRTASKLGNSQIKKLIEELESKILDADWITIVIMASHDFQAVKALKSIIKKYTSITFTSLDSLHDEGIFF